MGSNMFEGFMEGFTKTLGTGIMENEKARLQAEREAARDLRNENFARFQITNSNEQNKLSREASAAQNAASLKQNADQFRETNRRLTDTQSDQIFQDDAKREADQTKEKNKQINDNEQNRLNRESHEKIAKIGASGGEGGRNGTTAEIKNVKAMVAGGYVQTEAEGWERLSQAKENLPAAAASMANAQFSAQAQDITVRNKKTYPELYTEAISLLQGAANKPSSRTPASPTVKAADPGLYSSHSSPTVKPSVNVQPNSGKVQAGGAAPAQAITDVKANPALRSQFIAKFGYDPLK